MRWTKRGLLVRTPPPVPWAVSHATAPFVEPDGSALRLYFSGRDEKGRSVTGCAEFDPRTAALEFDGRALLKPGPLGAFDDAGAMGSCVVDYLGVKYLYYIGWSRGVSVPFYTFIGCALSCDGGRTFSRLSNAPILERSADEPFLTTSPWVVVDDGRWRMWYASGVGWERDKGAPKHYYNIRYAESDDGISWQRVARPCIDFIGEHEYAIARPCVIKLGRTYRAWYSYRGRAYRIGYAESSDGIEWHRKDSEVGIEASDEGWDSEMIEYPCVFEFGGDWYMLYNGNGYGATGIGLAILESDD
jgi:hypothetical protein